MASESRAGRGPETRKLDGRTPRCAAFGQGLQAICLSVRRIRGDPRDPDRFDMTECGMVGGPRA